MPCSGCSALHGVNPNYIYIYNIYSLSLSIYIKLTKFINKKHLVVKEEIHIEYKSYRNLLSTQMKKSKQAIGIISRTHRKELNS